jgi:endoglucanase
MTRFRDLRLSFPVLGLLTFGLAACDAPPDYDLEEGIANVAVSGGGVTVDVVTTNVWNTGFNGGVRITNTAFPAPITSFQVGFRLAGSAQIVGTGWNGTVSAADTSGLRTATQPDWLPSNPLRTGQTWEVGFTGANGFAGSTVVSVRINGQLIPVGGGDPNPPTVSLVSNATAVTTAGNILLTASATDDVGVARVEFLDGTTLLGTDTTAPFTQLVALTAANNGTRSYTARAFDAAGNNRTSTVVTVTVNIPGQTGGGAVFRVNSQGRITKNGQVFPVRCGSWFGLEGRHEPSNDAGNPSGAPMELYMGNTFWANGGAGTGRTMQQTMTEIVARGINVVRMPVVPQTLNPNDPQGRDPFLKNHASVKIANSRLALEQFIKLADQNNIEVMLDMHSCSNFVGWRKGRLDARPPWADFDRDNYDFKRENYSCAATGNPASVTVTHPYNETAWLNDLKTLAGMNQALGVDNIIGIDIYNEPHDYTWAEWKRLTEAAFAAINSVNPNTLLFVQGISALADTQDGTPTTTTAVPHGVLATNPNWGENLFEAGANPPNMPKERLVWSPHTYGPSVFVQKMFMDPAQPQCTGLEGDAAGNADCNIVINPTLLRQGWEEHFGYLKSLGYAIVVGEFGGNMDWPLGQASLRDRNRWSHITPGVDRAWQDVFTSYMIEMGIEGCYWSINPESGDTAGWYGHAYDPISNTDGWGEWRDYDARKTVLLNRLWGQ